MSQLHKQACVLCLLAFWLFMLSACATHSRHGNIAATSTGPLILISIDGLHPDYLSLAETPALDRIIDTGVRAEWMEPVFPSFTFPNHYSLVTGLYPAQHGIVANRMIDPEYDGMFTLGNSKEVANDFWWQGEPIWVTAEKQGLRSATLFWPGSEAKIAGHRPSDWLPYQHNLPHSTRIDQVLTWLDRPIDNRPELITLYFSSVDSAGHRHGPAKPPVIEALEEVDQHIGRLLDELAQRELLQHSHILIVSDHGMSQLSPDRRIYLDDYVDREVAKDSLLGPVAFLWPDADQLEIVEAALRDAHPAMRIARPEQLPEHFAFTGHRRIPPLLALAGDGWLITHRGPRAPYTTMLGAHGYDPQLPSMRTSFFARSPALLPGRVIAPISVLDVHPLMAHLLNLEPPESEGDLSVFESVLINPDAVE